MQRLTTILFCLLTTFAALAQDQLEMGVYIGYANYIGDLVQPSFTFNQSNLAGGAWLRVGVNKSFNVRSSLVFGKLEGDDAYYNDVASRGASFESPFVEGALVAEWEVLGKRKDMQEVGLLNAISPYTFGGLGLGLYNTSTKFRVQSPEASQDKSTNFSDFQFTVPIGFGLKAKINPSVSIGAEFGMRVSFTDYLDGVSHAGNPDNNDHYFSGGIMVGYTLGNNDLDHDGTVNRKDRCPKLPGPVKFNGCPDSDGDGITDAEDECPNDAGTVRLNGCPDADDDGIADLYDDCPYNAGIRRFGGCPDTDDDGIVDMEDNCPDEPGIPSLNGCPDSDRDGITDSKDHCPLDPGEISLNGCPDSDKDGIIDSEDECPVLAGPKENKGCPDKDTDEDGVVDRKDRCPDLAGPTNNNGCPEIKKEDQEVLNYATTNVEFETGSNELTPASKQILDKIIAILKKYDGYNLRISGHTDNVGDADKNLLLSEERAKACYNYLFLNGVKPTLLTYAGYGESRPIDDNDTEEGRMKNRRVEFVLTTEEF